MEVLHPEPIQRGEKVDFPWPQPDAVIGLVSMDLRLGDTARPAHALRPAEPFEDVEQVGEFCRWRRDIERRMRPAGLALDTLKLLAQRLMDALADLYSGEIEVESLSGAGEELCTFDGKKFARSRVNICAWSRSQTSFGLP